MSAIIYIPAEKARKMLGSGDYTALRLARFYPAYYGAQTYRARLCDYGEVRDIVFWKESEYQEAFKKYLMKLKNKKKKKGN